MRERKAPREGAGKRQDRLQGLAKDRSGWSQRNRDRSKYLPERNCQKDHARKKMEKSRTATAAVMPAMWCRGKQPARPKAIKRQGIVEKDLNRMQDIWCHHKVHETVGKTCQHAHFRSIGKAYEKRGSMPPSVTDPPFGMR